MGVPVEILFAALAFVLGGFGVAFLMIRVAGLTKYTLARLDFLSYTAGSGGVFSLVPDTVRMFAPQLMTSDPVTWIVLDHFKYLAFFLVSLSIGLGTARRWYSIQIEK
jgi:hypothetical protein